MQKPIDATPATPAENVDDEHDFINFRQLFRIITLRWRIVAAALCIGLSLSVVYLFLATKKYTSHAELLIAPPQAGGLVDIEALTTNFGEDERSIDNQVEILRSREFALQVTKRLELDQLDREKKESIFSRILPGFGNSEQQGAPLTDDYRLSDAADEVSKMLSVRRLGLSAIIKVSATSEDPVRSAAIVNTVLSVYLDDQIEWKRSSVKRRSDWLIGQLEEQRKLLNISERAVEEFRAETGLIDADGADLINEQRKDVNTELVNARAALAEKNARYRQVLSLVQAGQTTESIAEVLSSTVVSQLRAQEAEIGRRLAELRTRYGAQHPAVQDAAVEARDLSAQIDAEVSRIVTNLENEVSLARTRVNSVNQSLARLQNQAIASEQSQIRLRELERETLANKNLYEELLDGYKQAVVVSGADALTENARIISSAEPPRDPSHPLTALTLAIGSVLSVIFSMGLIFVLEILENGFRSTQELERTLQLVNLASVPILKEKDLDDDKPLRSFVIDKPLSSYTESHRKLRAALELSTVTGRTKLILVTSSLPGEGKSAMSTNLAQISATSGARTLLIDADLRKSTIHKIFGVDTEAHTGLVDVLMKKTSLEQSTVPSGVENLDLLINTKTPHNSSDLLASSQMKSLLNYAAELYDFVVIDSAPVLPVADTPLLCSQADIVLFLVRREATSRDAAKNAVRILRRHGARIAGAVLTFVDMSKPHKLDFSDSEYYYGYYSKYYADDEQKTSS